MLHFCISPFLCLRFLALVQLLDLTVLFKNIYVALFTPQKVEGSLHSKNNEEMGFSQKRETWALEKTSQKRKKTGISKRCCAGMNRVNCYPGANYI